MKKFLTVLLALSVVFTYSFSAVGSVFAASADPDPGTGTDTDYIAAAVKELTDELQETAASIKIANTYTETFGTESVKISGEYYKATLAEIVADYTKVIDQASKADSVRLDNGQPKTYNSVTDAKTAILNAAVNYEIYNNTNLVLHPSDVIGASKLENMLFNAANAANDASKIYAIKTWARALDAMKVEVNAELAKIDLSLYTNDVMQPADVYNTTYAQAAANKKAELEQQVKDVVVSVETAYDDNVTAIENLYKIVKTNLEVATSYVNINNETVVLTYAIKNIKTAADLDAENAGDKADIAAKKAAVQASGAAALKVALDTYNASSKDATAKAAYDAAQENIAAFVEIENFLAEAQNNVFSSGYDPNYDYTQILKNYAAVEAEAAVLKLMVEKDGTPKYIAAVIDENLADVKEDVFASTKSVEEAKAYLIVGATASNYDLAWEKEKLIAQIEKAMNDGLEAAPGFYAPEEAKVKAEYAKIIAKVNAAETKGQLEVVKPADYLFTTVKGSIQDKTAVNNTVKGLLNTETMLSKVNRYVSYLNGDLKSWEDGYRADATLEDLAEYLAEAGARTNADVAAKYGEAEAYANSLPTNGVKNAAVEKAKALIKALPTPVVTLTDKAQIEEAYVAAKEAGMENDATLARYINYVKNLEQSAIDNAIKALPAKITSADKAAVKAIDEMIKAYNDTEMYGADTNSSVATQLAAVKAADKAAVEAAIAALPVNPTKAEVEAVRALVDAYTAEYRDVLAGDKADTFINLEKLIYAEAQVKANQIKAVEALKITASSTAKKGSITVKWTVKGDAEAVDGYQVYRSLKKNSGFGTKPYFKTTKKSYKNTKELKKGTRYYYKVRAYKVVDGKTYYSDWSNKAYRIAK